MPLVIWSKREGGKQSSRHIEKYQQNQKESEKKGLDL